MAGGVVTAIRWTVVVGALWVAALSGVHAQQREVQEIWTGTITARSLNVRSGPGEGYEIIAKLRRGDEVDAVDQVGRWVRLDGEEQAWVHRSFVKLPKSFLAPAFSEGENAFLDWAAERGDLAEISVESTGRISMVLAEGRSHDTEAIEAIAREVGCAYRERAEHAGRVTVTVWPADGPANGWLLQATCGEDSL